MLCVVATPLYIYKLWAMDGEKFSTSFGHYHFTSFLFFAFLPLSFYLLILFLFCLYLLSSFLFLSLSFLSFYSFVFIIKRDESKKALSVLFATNIKKNKSQFISFLFRLSFGVKRTICFLILLSLPFPPRTAGLNSCCYDAQRQAARRLPG